ncbi:MAG: helix-turn-helix transcriptional regulator [Acidimicrobiales bacterium]|nr:helix-turn-helix transcriptional regulator [Acidimicrobiales bacterium]
MGHRQDNEFRRAGEESGSADRRGRRSGRLPFDGPGGPFRGGRRHPGGPWGPPRGRGGGRRARRGDVKVALLALLSERPMHGYEMIGELSDRTNGIWSPSPGSVYPTLQLLEEEGLINSEEVDGKRRFSLTDEGRSRLAEADEKAPWERFVGAAEELALADALRGLMPAVKQVMEVGSPAQQESVTALLVETRRKVYEVLAGE